MTLSVVLSFSNDICGLSLYFKRHMDDTFSGLSLFVAIFQTTYG